ncbi:NAD(P)/FAD-dependent oxidoreductase [Agromyces aerolatus]|uniref:NAD(P)/FAD-dependent oxidoreductase n=1 Tax=Agromyces sp. LY-1074 TaxID=3074080 RepID=UPI002857C08A|nr:MULTISPECIES: FAD-dependent oxidoreductase [unclassified Agromyces]MDR5699330.1 FAD-dependent oxidoreductase [Agromyces sp. LY-1074]MDR5705626.1 FAD-dependent oxidoreductase [Agromyces sp. LY-1358]
MSTKRDVVIGGGVVGLSCAYHLASLGRDVIVLEAAAGPAGGASSHNAGWVVPSMSEPVPSPQAIRLGLKWLLRGDSPLGVAVSPDPAYIAFLVRMLAACRERPYREGIERLAALNAGTFDAFDRLRADGVEFEEHRSGVLYALTTEASAARVIADLQRMETWGTPPPRVVRGGELTALEPALRDRFAVGILCDRERHIDPGSFASALAARVRSLGVDVRTHSRVASVKDRGRFADVALSDGETLAARHVIVAAGAASGGIRGIRRLRSAVQAGRGYGIDVMVTSGATPRHAIYLPEDKVAVTPLDAKLRFAGIMEFGPPGRTRTDRSEQLLRAARRSFSDLDPDAVTPWAADRPMTPDGLPLIGRLPGSETLSIATGHAMLGVTLAPVTGQLLAAEIVSGRDEAALAAFSPRRLV